MSRPPQFSRRVFIGGAAASVSSVLLSDVAIAETGPLRHWDQEADVIVVGTGAAGMSAAIAASKAGSSVLIIEKAAAAGGTTTKSDGAYWIPNNHYMRAKGIDDPREDAIHFMARASFPTLYREGQPRYGLTEHAYSLIEAYYDQAAPTIEALEKEGILKSMLVAELTDYLDHWPENKASRGRILLPLDIDGQMGRGVDLVRQLRSWLDARKVPFIFRCAADALIRNGKQEVIGLSAKGRNGPLFLRARKAVIFGSGGYTHNADLVLNHQPGPIFGGCAVPTNQGDFIRIAGSAGAKLGNMVHGWRAQVVLESALQAASVSRDLWQPPGDSMILVNKRGRRVVNEKRNYHERTLAHFEWDANESEYRNAVLFMIYDKRTAELFAGNFPLPVPGDSQPYVIEARGIAALRNALQVRLNQLAPRVGRIELASDFADALTKQMDRFNADALQGLDQEFGRGRYPYDKEWHSAVNSVPRTDTSWPVQPGPNPTIYPIDSAGPLYAIILGAGMLDTNGGPVIDSCARVIDLDGNPVPGLYGAGNCIASPAGGAYWGAGGTIGPALTFGTLAGRYAAAERMKEDR